MRNKRVTPVHRRRLKRSLRARRPKLTRRGRAAVSAAKTLLAFVNSQIKREVGKRSFVASHPAKLHDELRFFLEVFEPYRG